MIKSPKFSALGMTALVRFLQGAPSIFHNSDRSESSYFHCAYPNPVPLLLAAPLEVYEMTWKCLDFPALGFSEALLNFFHQPNSSCIPVANQAIHAIYLIVLLSTPYYHFGFRILWIHAAGLPEALHSYFHFFLVLDFRCIC